MRGSVTLELVAVGGQDALDLKGAGVMERQVDETDAVATVLRVWSNGSFRERLFAAT